MLWDCEEPGDPDEQVTKERIELWGCLLQIAKVIVERLDWRTVIRRSMRRWTVLGLYCAKSCPVRSRRRRSTRERAGAKGAGFVAMENS